MKQNITVSIPDPSLLVIERELEDWGRLPWSKLSKIMEMRTASSRAIRPISKTRYQKTTRYRRSQVKLEILFWLITWRIPPQDLACTDGVVKDQQET